ncbi:hypothetical protein FQN54_007772 [Arachnomyces sp. PD_36]|nr:hypothetical protein FQN54_007772 [Arachnomyces sp. PD_36]
MQGKDSADIAETVDTAELQNFRKQWKEEVLGHADPEPSSSNKAKAPEQSTSSTAKQSSATPAQTGDDTLAEDHGHPPLSQRGDDDLQKGMESLHLEKPADNPSDRALSALETFEMAAEKEAQGSMGDSLKLYRQAYRLDSSVDKTYRKVHHPGKAGSRLSGTVTSVPKPKVDPSGEDPTVIPTADLIASFAVLAIPPAEPTIEGDPPPPCPIAQLPSEVIVEIFHHIPLVDPAMVCRVSMVCKRFAYHATHEHGMWKRLCLGREFGFAGQHYSFTCDLEHNPIHLAPTYCPPFSAESKYKRPPKPLRTWSQVFQSFPRIRYTGAYISTVNYNRPGAASVTQQATWNAPIHIVTYYRYLRFYPDGTLISLLTTTEPAEIIPHFSKENILAARTAVPPRHRRHIPDSNPTAQPTDTAAATAPINPVPPAAASALKYGLRGRFYLCAPELSKTTHNKPSPAPTDLPPSAINPPSSLSHLPTTPRDPRDVVIETEGVDSKYTYAMHLTLRSASLDTQNLHSDKEPRNTSKNMLLEWKGFWSYNNLTDDWGEFGLRNDRSFAFKSVKGWGL